MSPDRTKHMSTVVKIKKNSIKTWKKYLNKTFLTWFRSCCPLVWAGLGHVDGPDHLQEKTIKRKTQKQEENKAFLPGTKVVSPFVWLGLGHVDGPGHLQEKTIRRRKLKRRRIQSIPTLYRSCWPLCLAGPGPCWWARPSAGATPWWGTPSLRSSLRAATCGYEINKL